MRPPITKVQIATLNYLSEFISKHDYSPTLSEISRHFNISIRASYDRIEALMKKGYIERNRGARTIRVLNDMQNNDLIPLFTGKISAGIPFESAENIESYLPLNQNYFPKGEYFALSVKGDSMINAGIMDGDVIIVKKQNYAHNKDIIVAMIEGETTVKRVIFEKDLVILQAENPKYGRIIKKYVNILGIVMGLLRRFK